MRKLNVLIAEDEVPSRALIRKLVETRKELRVMGVAVDGEETLQEVTTREYDLLLLDINLPRISGIQVLEKIREREVKPYIIFTTAHNKYAIKAFDYNASDFLLKPIARDRFNQAIEKFLASVEKNSIMQFEALSTRIGMELNNHDVNFMHPAIDNALAGIGAFLCFDRSTLLGCRNGMLVAGHEWCAQDAPSMRDCSPGLEAAAYPWFARELAGRDHLVVESIDALPAEAAGERELLLRRGAVSCILFPLRVRGRIFGVYAHELLTGAPRWSEAFIQSLKTSAIIFANVFERMEHNENRVRELFHSLSKDETCCLGLLAAGKTNNEIIKVMGCVRSQIYTYKKRIIDKYHVHFPAEALQPGMPDDVIGYIARIMRAHNIS